jgi:hypothetical protein
MKINEKKQVSLMVSIAFLGMLFTGCTTRLVDFTAISTKNVDWSRAASYQRNGTRIKGKDTVHIIIFFPTGVPNMKEAIDRAIESVPGGVALVDGVVSVKSFYIPLIYGQNSYVVEGSVLVDPALAKNGTVGEYMIARLDKEGNLAELTSVSQKDYAELTGSAL